KADCNYDCRAKIIRDVFAEVEVVLIIQDQTRKLAERYYKQEYEDSYPASLGRTGLDQHLHTLPSKDAEAGFLGYLRVIIKNGSSIHQQRSEERRVGKNVEIGGRGMMNKRK